MRRRGFLGFAAAAAGPGAALAPPAPPMVDILTGQSHSSFPPLLATFRDGLASTGFVEGRTVLFETRLGEGDNDPLPGLARALVDRKVSVLFACSSAAGRAARGATDTIPIVYTGMSDEVIE